VRENHIIKVIGDGVIASRLAFLVLSILEKKNKKKLDVIYIHKKPWILVSVRCE
jgi:hypothetical protein